MTVHTIASAATLPQFGGRARPPFRAEHVGSLLRPSHLQQARAQFEAGQIGEDQLQAIEDAAIVEAVVLQEAVGLRSITDGEFRRAYFHLDFLVQVAGMESYVDHGAAHFRTASGHEFDFSPPKLRITGKLDRRHPIMRRDYQVIAEAISGDGAAKITIPSPTMALRGGRGAVDRAAYPDLSGFHADLARVFREEIDDLAAAGCRYLQLDDTNLAYLCDEKQRDAARLRGEDPALLPSLYARVINDSLASAPADMFIGIHLCRGNFRSAFVAEGGYDPVAEVLFNETNVDAFFLEYDDERSGGFDPLRFVPRHKYVVLGVISSKVARLETKDEVKRRIDEAAKVLPLEQLCLSPQCGFSSTSHGNDVSFDDQRRKLELTVDCAREIWGGT
ncbi:MAG TPA: 5-methyltetrahydropteroyltriglutamate--homocysteine S-methyltransferase [Caulobacteraceae bacterium]